MCSKCGKRTDSLRRVLWRGAVSGLCALCYGSWAYHVEGLPVKYEVPQKVTHHLHVVAETVQMASGGAGSGDRVPFDWFAQGMSDLQRVWAFKKQQEHFGSIMATSESAPVVEPI